MASLQQPPPLIHSPSPAHQQHEPYDFSNDPFLQEFAAANALGGIVVVDNALHQSSSAESTPSIQQQHANSYAKFFADFSAAILGGNGMKSKNCTVAEAGKRLATSAIGGNGSSGGGIEQQHSNSNEQLLVAGGNSSTGEGSDTGSGNSHDARTSATITTAATGAVSGRVMREIIV